MRTSLIFLALPLLAFHEGGSGNCDGCHIMHDSQDGMPQSAQAPLTDGLLKAETASDLCLSCHAHGNGSVLGQGPLNPYPERGGGNFVFLLEENLNDSESVPGIVPGEAGGHNVNAPGHGLWTDSRWSLSPGGSFPASLLECTSCHDPHGNSSFRLLYGAGEIQAGLATFRHPAPKAGGMNLLAVETDLNHTAYRSGISDWCGNCHGPYHDDGWGEGNFEHPSDLALGSSISLRYNLYNGDSDPSGGDAATAYLAQVPFQDAGAGVSSSGGPAGSSRVMCLTCHRAHASSSPAAGRWDFAVSTLGEDGVLSGSYALRNPYNDSSQGSLCRKCHGSTQGVPLP